MKRILAILLVTVLSLSVCLVSYAESADTTEDQDQEVGNDVNVEDLVLESDTYSAWVDLSWPIIYNYYVQATWLSSNYFKISTYKGTEEINVDFLLAEDALTLTKDQLSRAGRLYSYLEDDYYVSKYSSGGRGKVLVFAYNLLHSAPTVLDKLSELHSNISVPAEYADFDATIMETISNLKSVSESLKNQITSSGTVTGWDSPLNRDKPEQLYAIFKVMK